MTGRHAAPEPRRVVPEEVLSATEIAAIAEDGGDLEAVAAIVAGVDDQRQCAWCGTWAPSAAMEPISDGPSVACRDVHACRDRIVAAAIVQARALSTIRDGARDE